MRKVSAGHLEIIQKHGSKKQNILFVFVIIIAHIETAQKEMKGNCN